MRLALTGATGFVGKHVIAAATRRGYEVVAFTRNPSRPVDGCVETMPFSLDAPPNLAGCDAVIHLAGESVVGLWTPAKKRRVRESRVLGTRRIVEAIRSMPQPPEVLVSASAVGYYGGHGEQDITEKTGPGTGFLAETCVQWERETEPAREKCRVAIVRVSSVFGRGGMLRTLRPIFRLGLGGRLGSGRQWLSWIHVDDLASMLLFAVENLEATGPMNGAAPWPVRNADFTREVARALHRPAFFPVPGFFLRMIFGDFGRSMLESQRVLPAAPLDYGFPFRFSEATPALRDSLA